MVFLFIHNSYLIEGYKLENCVSIYEFNKRLGELDSKINFFLLTKILLYLELLQKQHEIYVTPHPIEIPYYLCIKTSALMNTVANNQERQNRKHIDNIYGKKDLEHEYWFSVPKEK
jgi:hypothetical protein